MQRIARTKLMLCAQAALLLLLACLLTTPTFGRNPTDGEGGSSALGPECKSSVAGVGAVGASFGEVVTKGIHAGTATKAAVAGAAVAAGILILTGSNTANPPAMNIGTPFKGSCP